MSQKIPPCGSWLGNYLVCRSQSIPELNLTAVILKHQPTGARLFHINNDDPNNVFAIGFRTPPPDSTGVAHILEHTVLCGSQKYPVRDPFFAMLKRSLNTFMNAMTAADWTLYPVASMNPKDLNNLIEIYLDAVFFPLLRKTDFSQEGHRLEFSDPTDSKSNLQFKGVVFNEMKGAMADPSSLLGRRMNRGLFPTSCYGKNSGGEPSEIPELTWEDLRAFHQRFYHPSNSWIFTYGNMPLEGHLEKFETLALNKFQTQFVESEIWHEQRFRHPIKITETFPIGEDEDPSQRCMVQLAWLTCPIEETFERVATGILANLLLGNPAAPLYHALIESQLGQNLTPGTGYHDDYRDTYLAAGLQGTHQDQVEKIEALIMETLERIADQGFPRERVDAALHQYEFSNREVTGDQYPYGLSLLMRFFGSWLHADNPIDPLCIDSTLKQLKKATSDDTFLPKLIRKHFLNNPHRVTLLLKPDKDHDRRQEQIIQSRLEQISKELDETKRKNIVASAIALQKAQESHEDTNCLPTLEIEDIVPEERKVSYRLDESLSTKVFHFEQPTNGISNLTLQFDLNGLPKSLHSDVPLFCTLLPQIGAAGHSYLDMTRRITAATGGIRLGANLLEDPDTLENMRPVVDLKAKALDRNQAEMTSILKDMLTSPNFDDLDRLRTVIGQVKTAMENSIPGAGHTFASRAAAESLTPAAHLREAWSGMSQVKRIRQASVYENSQLTSLADNFKRIAQNILVRHRTTIALTAEPKSHDAFQQNLKDLLNSLPENATHVVRENDEFRSKAAAIGWNYALPVSYVARVFRTVPYSHPDAAPLHVLSKLLRANFLHREVREKGGAYGGLAGYSPEGGLLSLLSYRDPQLARTLDVYRQAVDWACHEKFSQEMLKEAILAVFGELDRPLSPAGRGYHEFTLFQQGITPEKRQAYRYQVLSTTAKDLNRVAEHYLLGLWQDSCVGLLASEQMLKQAQGALDGMSLQTNKL
ncbi:MAG: insulinase family protein [Deltaproteobacteria bacterium]|jgi:Zn-dependent M16 (insulinase) family peptidase|nr:insulinase family protein [Deltaproteobacteria bacterium]